MPEINKIVPVEYSTLHPYHADYDNLPLRNIITRQEIINGAVDINSEILRESTGSQLTLAARLDRSLDGWGDLEDAAVDKAMHNIAFHTDGTDGYTDFVRMEQDERDKLALISDEATALRIRFPTISTASVIQEFADETIEIIDSSTISWQVAGNNIQAITSFEPTALHLHHWGLEPVHSNTVTPDYTHYKTTGTGTPTQFISGTLRVFINGVRIFDDVEVYVPRPDNSAYDLIMFTPDSGDRSFTLSRAINSVNGYAYIIHIDFDETQEVGP